MALLIGIGDFFNSHSGAVAAVSTVVIAVFTAILARATLRIHKHSNVSERAYVKMSHKSGGRYGEGLFIDRASNTAKVVIEVKNFGRTPANVIGLCLCWDVLPKGQPLPAKPNYRPPKDTHIPTTAFLVAGDFFYAWRKFEKIPDEHLDKIEARDMTAFVYGYVDYIDIFGQCHRGGYARQYDPDRTGNNLIFMAQSGYDYDRPIKKRTNT
ncbi:MAG: hypothetical protein IIA72_24380 [Proteobacteria bacterium]|nr:hypothetical protein [Pseudomonadota bacterium]